MRYAVKPVAGGAFQRVSEEACAPRSAEEQEVIEKECSDCGFRTHVAKDCLVCSVCDGPLTEMNS